MTGFHFVELPSELTVVGFPDPTVEALGFGPDDPYIENCILSQVGPSSVMLWRRLSRAVIEAGNSPVNVDTIDMLACIGLKGLGKSSTGARTMARMVAFDLARRAGRDGNILAVRQALAPLRASLVDRLPPSARRYHDQVTGVRRSSD